MYKLQSSRKCAPVTTTGKAFAIWRAAHFEFVENDVTREEIVQHGTQVVVQGNGFHGFVLHVHVPDFHCEVVARHKEASVFRISMKYNKLEQRKVKSKERSPAMRQIDVVRKANTTNTTKYTILT